MADEWFDVFNSKTKDRDSKKSRHAFGLYLEHQKAVVNNMINTVKAMKVCGKQYLFPFQKGMVISCKSLLALYAFLNEKFKSEVCADIQIKSGCFGAFLWVH